MKDQRPSSSEVHEQVQRHVRRRVGLKVLGDLGRWAQGVEREQRERPRLVLMLLAIVALVTIVTALLL